MSALNFRPASARYVEPKAPPTSHSVSKALANLVSDSIDETLTDLLGSRTREAVYGYLQRKYSLTKNDLANNPDQLFTIFERNFGVPAKRVIGRAIARKVYTKLDWKFQPVPHFEFADYMDKVKARFASTS